jgi:hypothetical protein
VCYEGTAEKAKVTEVKSLPFACWPRRQQQQQPKLEGAYLDEEGATGNLRTLHFKSRFTSKVVR